MKPTPNSGRSYHVIVNQIFWCCAQKTFTIPDMATYFRSHPNSVRKAVHHFIACGVVKKIRDYQHGYPPISVLYAPCWTIYPAGSQLQPAAIQLPVVQELPQPLKIPVVAESDLPPEVLALSRLLSIVEDAEPVVTSELHPELTYRGTDKRCKHGLLHGMCSTCRKLYASAEERKAA